MRDLSGRPPELKYDYKGDEIDQLSRLVSIRTPNAAKKNEWKGCEDAKSTNQVPAFTFPIPVMA